MDKKTVFITISIVFLTLLLFVMFISIPVVTGIVVKAVLDANKATYFVTKIENQVLMANLTSGKITAIGKCNDNKSKFCQYVVEAQ